MGAEEVAERLVDLTGVLAHPHLLALASLQRTGRSAVADGRFPDSARHSATWGKVTPRRSGLTWNRSDISTIDWSRLGSRNVTRPSGVVNTARLRACKRQNATSSASSAIAVATVHPRTGERNSAPATAGDQAAAGVCGAPA